MNPHSFGRIHKSRLIACVAAFGVAISPLRSIADDIDIFVASSAGVAINPNVLIVLDNTSNWKNSLGSSTQGETELNAIKAVVGLLDGTINIGLMMLVDSGGGGRAGGYIRFPVLPMNAQNKGDFTNNLNNLIANFGKPSQKSPSNADYGEVLFEAYKYFGGFTNPAHIADDVGSTPYGDATKPAGTITFTHTDGTTSTVTNTPNDAQHFGPNVYTTRTDWSLADARGYASTATSPPVFNSPISEDNNCAKNYIIFIGNGYPNPDNQNPNDFTILSTLGGDIISIPTSPSTSDRSGDEWTRFLSSSDVSPAKGTQNVATFTIDVFDQSKAGVGQVANQTAMLQSMAKVGGGTYYPATNAAAVVDSLKKAFDEILAVNSTFASASLPISATNRTVNDNQVFIGMFRPDPTAKPRWFGNTKEYKLIQVGSSIELGDVNGIVATNPASGFITSCATSSFTTDSGTYWQSTTYMPRPIGTCPTSPYSPYSDSPDGPIVEKGGVAEVIRRGNSAATNTTADWVLRRTLYTQSGNALIAFTTGTSGLSQSLFDFTSGKDTGDENENQNTTETRPSLHGDVIHSRPLAINYGAGIGTYLFYGANDGTLRAVEATQSTGTGREVWAFIAPEFFQARMHPEATPSSIYPLARLQDNSPLVLYPDMTAPPASAAKRDYFFDGSTGTYQATGSSPTVWIYPTMRRGGRMFYALDVTTPTLPSFKWKAGCDSLNSCTSNMSGIGQTWSLPKVARVKGYSTTTRVLIVGGGYDACEDANTSSPSCGSTTGNHVYVFNADTGEWLKTFDTARSVAADVALLDIDGDQMIDHVYVADTGGSIYRIDFVDPLTKAPRASTDWTMAPVARTSGFGRKFLFAPVLFAYQGKVYVALGSGDREHPLQSQYPFTTPVTNRLYVYIDDATITPDSSQPINLDGSSMCNLTSLPDSTPGCDTALLPSSTKKGWYIDLTGNGVGEQTVTTAVITGGLLAFSTNRPIPQAAGTCAVSLGEARGYWLNLFNACGAVSPNNDCGPRSAKFSGAGGLPPSPVLASVTLDGASPVEIVIGAVQRAGGSSTPISPQLAPTNASSKRKLIFWNTSSDK